MDVTLFERGNEAELVKYLQSQDVAVIVWKQTSEQFDRIARQRCEQERNDGQTLGKDVQERVEAELVQMGFRRGQTGFYNIVAAILEILKKRQGQPIRVTSDVYLKVAERHGCTVSSVERTIRNAIESVWKRTNLHTLEIRYPFPCDNQNGRPTNAEFLMNMAGRFREN
ncbi:MAG: sporulation initiation factor Spo0A C-terminal domain-containing protein [Eubacterium sp.]|nr:sporulation initiation factor Spo0A C-terminal domain-containing protein [Eubacterium sp.]